jgi:hypothetical protein
MSGINVKFGATDAGFTSTVNKVKDSTKSLDTTVAKTSSSVNASFASMAKAGAALALGFGAIKMAAAAVTGTFGAFKDALDLGGELSDLSDQTGETSGNLLVLQRAFDNSGVGADKVGTSINKMQKVLVDAAAGSEEAQEKFSNLGLSWSEMATKSPTEQLQMLAKAISELPTPAERAAASMEFFGKSGGRTLAFLQDFDGAIANAKGELGTMPDIMEKNARTFDTISDKLTVIGGKFKEFAAGVLGEMTPMLETITTGLAGIDMAGFGKRLAQAFIGGTAAMEGFNAALGAMKIGEFSLAFDIAFSSIKLQAAQSANSIYANFKAAFAAFPVLIRELGITGIFENIAAGLSNKFSSAIRGVIAEFLGAIGKVQAAADFDLLSKADSVRAENYFTMVNAGISSIGDNIGSASEAAQKAYEESLKSTGQLIDTTGMELDLQKQKTEVMKLQNEKAQEALKNAGDFGELEIKIGEQRVTNAQRIKELESEIKDAKAQGNVELEKELTAQKAYYEQLERSLAKGKTLQESIAAAGKAYSTSIENSVTSHKKVTKELKEQLSLSDEIIKRIKQAEGKDAVDKGGKLEKAAGDAIAEGDFRKAERIAEKLKGKEQDAAIREEFGGDKKGRLSTRDMAKSAGIDTTGKSNKELKKEMQDRIGKRKEELPDGQRGKADKDADGKVKPAGKTLHDVVEAIRVLVEKIEPKLPTTALGA